MDKQIIIDGCDVSRCRYYDDRYGYCEACKDDIDGTSFTKCMYEDDCYYKQLKRSEAQCEGMFVTHTDLEKKYEAKEQECDMWKNLTVDNGAVALKYQEQLDQLKFDYAELEKRHNDSFVQFEEVRKQNKSLKQYNDSKQASYEKMQQQWNEVELENRKLKAKNEELKKINNHIEHNRNQKANKLMRIEKLITTCSTGYTDEFVQSILVILLEAEPTEE